MTDIVERLRKADVECGWQTMIELNHEAAAEIERLKAALHRISLGAQNSSTTKDALGREARKALEGRDD